LNIVVDQVKRVYSGVYGFREDLMMWSIDYYMSPNYNEMEWKERYDERGSPGLGMSSKLPVWLQTVKLQCPEGSRIIGIHGHQNPLGYWSCSF
jgi:hypothetical protein